MITIGDKIRRVRTLKGLSQENMAEMLGLSVLAYGEIERGKTDIKLSRLGQIAEKLGVSAAEILKFGDTVSNFFDQCNQTNVVTGQNGNQSYYNDNRELQHKLEKALLENEKLNLKVEKAELEAKYWRERRDDSLTDK